MHGRRVVIGNRGRGSTAGRLWWRVPLALALWSLWAAPIIGGLVALHVVRGWAKGLPPAPDLTAWQADAPRTSTMLAADGTVLAELPFAVGREVGRRELVRRADLPPVLVDAILAAEDVRFRDHGGVDLRSVARAAWANYQAGRVVEGASTITQQVARNLLPDEIGTTRSARRKVREGLLAALIERRFDKDQILEAYVNFVFLGNNAYGVVAGARAYFDKALDQLTAAEAATLAGLIQAPGRLDPTRNPDGARRRRDEILARMKRAGWLDEGAARAAQASPLGLRPAAPPSGELAPWYAEQVRRIATDGMPETIGRGGLVLETAAQPALAAEAQAAAVARTAALDRGQGPPELAAIAWDHRTGYVDALVGGRDASASEFDRAVQGCRQPGSAWKPLVYAAALERGAITQGTPLRDAPIVAYDQAMDVHWRPRAGKHYRGVALAADALAASLNAPAIEVMDRVGPDGVIDLARRLGINTEVDDVRPMALGTSCVRPIELARAYAILARRGWPVAARFITRIRRGDDVIIDYAVPEDPHLDPTRRFDRLAATAGLPPDERIGAPRPGRVLDEASAFLIDDLLTGPVQRGTATAARGLGRPVAGKTGTTNDNTDAWFVGFSARTTLAVWVGHDRQAVELGPRDDGAHAALPLWLDVMRLAEGVRPPGPVPGAPPPELVQAKIDRETGLLAAPGAPGATLWFRPGSAPVDVAAPPSGTGRDLGRQAREF
jgi:penicillin-binding protein 1A